MSDPLPRVRFHRAALLGSGSSSSTPSLRCLMSSHPCAACLDAHQNPNSRNCRHNPSLLLQFQHPAVYAKGGALKRKVTEESDASGALLSSVLIDCGKTFRQVALKWFPFFGVRYIRAVLLTHEHADAVMGLDDLREFERKEGVSKETQIQVYADEFTTSGCKRIFNYLFPRSEPPADGASRWVASLSWQPLPPVELLHIPICEANDAGTYETAYLPVVSVPVLHGGNYYSNAFVFRLTYPEDLREGEDASVFDVTPESSPDAIAAAAHRAEFLLYISDVSTLTEEMYCQLDEAKRMLLFGSSYTPRPTCRTDAASSRETRCCLPSAVAVLDMLAPLDSRSTHFDIPHSLEATRRIAAEKTFYVGMSHSLSYEEVEQRIAMEPDLVGKAFCGFDGLVIAGEGK